MKQASVRIKIICAAFLLLTFFGACNGTKEPRFIRSTPPVTVLIPAGFTGDLRVVYEEPCGMEPPTENGRQVFRFPASGVLVLQSKNSFFNTRDAAYFFVDNAGNRKAIKQVIDKQKHYTILRGGKTHYFNDGNATLQTRVEAEPVIVIKGTAYKSLEVLNYVNGVLQNKGKTGAEYVEYGVYGAGPVDSTSFAIKVEAANNVEEAVNACRGKKG